MNRNRWGQGNSFNRMLRDWPLLSGRIRHQSLLNAQRSLCLLFCDGSRRDSPAALPLKLRRRQSSMAVMYQAKRHPTKLEGL